MGNVGNGFVINQWTGSSRSLINSLTEDQAQYGATHLDFLSVRSRAKGLSTDIIY